MKESQIVALACLLLASSLAGCQQNDPNRKETFPVAGEVYVDGQPAAMLRVDLHDVKGMDQQNPTVSSAFTDDQGKFSISTYEASDGVPAGDYILTFFWGEVDVLSRSYSGPDKLKDRYLDPQKSPHKITVEPGKPVEIGRIELTTK